MLDKLSYLNSGETKFVDVVNYFRLSRLHVRLSLFTLSCAPMPVQVAKNQFRHVTFHFLQRLHSRESREKWSLNEDDLSDMLIVNT